MHYLASRGWVCVAINYRLAPKHKFPHQLLDVKRALAWIRTHIAEHGGDPDLVVVTGPPQRLAGVAQPGVATDHFGHHQPGPELGAEPAERQVGDTRHGSQRQEGLCIALRFVP